MHYNLKIIEYPNGDTQVRQYSTPMRCKECNGLYEDEFERDPFHQKRVQEVENFDGLSSSQDAKDENVWRNSNRTKQMVFMYSRCYEWEWFITLTFSAEKVDRYNYDECSNRARKWLNNQRNRYAPDLKYLLVPEQHKDGAWHFHGLLADTGSMRFIDSGHKENGQVIYNMVKWQYGFTTATAVKDVHKVAKYIGKYITKSLCDITPGRQRYFVSRNLPMPKVSTMLIGDDGDFETAMSFICESLGKEIAHVSRTRAIENYTQVTYYELG